MITASNPIVAIKNQKVILPPDLVTPVGATVIVAVARGFSETVASAEVGEISLPLGVGLNF